MTNKDNNDPFSRIKGHFNVKKELSKQLDVLKGLELFDNVDSSSKGVCLFGEKEHGKKFIAKAFALTLGRECLVYSWGQEQEANRQNINLQELKNKIDDILSRGIKKITLLLLQADRADEITLKTIYDSYSSITDVYVVATIDSDNKKVTEYCQLITSAIIPVLEPTLEEKRDMLSYLVYEKYRCMKFIPTIDEMLELFVMEGYRNMDRYIMNSVAKAVICQEDITLDRIAEEMYIAKPCIDENGEYVHRTGVHEAGHALMALLLDNKVKGGIIHDNVTGNTFYDGETRNRFHFNNPNNMVLICLAGRAAEEIYYGDLGTGHAYDLDLAIKQVLERIAEDGYYGLDYLRIEDSPAQKNKIDRKAHEVINDSYREVMERLNPYKELLGRIGKLVAERRYVSFTEIKGFLEEFRSMGNETEDHSAA